MEDLETLAAKIENDKDRDQLLSKVRAPIALEKQKSQKTWEKPFSERLTVAVSKTWEDTSRALSLITVYKPDWEVAGWVKTDTRPREFKAVEQKSRSRRAYPGHGMDIRIHCRTAARQVPQAYGYATLSSSPSSAVS